MSAKNMEIFFYVIFLSLLHVTFELKSNQNTKWCFKVINTEDYYMFRFSSSLNFLPDDLQMVIDEMERDRNPPYSEKFIDITVLILEKSLGRCRNRFKFGKRSSDANLISAFQINLYTPERVYLIESLYLELQSGYESGRLFLYGSKKRVGLPVLITQNPTVHQRPNIANFISRRAELAQPNQMYCFSLFDRGPKIFSKFQPASYTELPSKYLEAGIYFKENYNEASKTILGSHLVHVFPCDKTTTYQSSVIIQELDDKQQVTITVEKALVSQDLTVNYQYRKSNKKAKVSGNWDQFGKLPTFTSANDLSLPLSRKKIALYQTSTVRQKCVFDDKTGWITDDLVNDRVLAREATILRPYTVGSKISVKVAMTPHELEQCLKTAQVQT